MAVSVDDDKKRRRGAIPNRDGVLMRRSSLKKAPVENSRWRQGPGLLAYSAADLNCADSVDSPIAVVDDWPPDNVLATRSK